MGLNNVITLGVCLSMYFSRIFVRAEYRSRCIYSRQYKNDDDDNDRYSKVLYVDLRVSKFQ